MKRVYKQPALESGQSLLEMLLVVPVFLVCLWGAVVLVLQCERVFFDGTTGYNLSYSSVFFSQEEKVAAGWDVTEHDDANGFVFNGLFPRRVLEKLSRSSAGNLFEVGGQQNLLECVQGTRKSGGMFTRLASHRGVLHSCAGFEGYESWKETQPKEFHQKPSDDNGGQRVFQRSEDVVSAYLPSDDFAFDKRARMAPGSVKDFLLSGEAYSYFEKVADPGVGIGQRVTQKQFNSSVFMDAGRGSVVDLGKRLKLRSRAVQILGCAAEHCAKAPHPATCAAGLAVSLGRSQVGIRAGSLCPVLDKMVEETARAVRLSVKARLIDLETNERLTSAELLGPM